MPIEPLLITLTALLPIINPLSTAPLCLTLTEGMETRARLVIVSRACLYAFLILAVFLIVGDAVIDFFGISIEGIRIAGGAIIARIGFLMLNPPNATTLADGHSQRGDIAFAPLALPSLAGPGSIAVVLSLGVDAAPASEPIVFAAILMGVAITLLIAFVVLTAAVWVVRVIGPAIMNAMTRVMGFLLVCIGAQFMLDGVRDFFGLA